MAVYLKKFNATQEHTNYTHSAQYREPYASAISDDEVYFNQYDNEYYINTDEYIVKSYLRSPGHNTGGSLIDTGIRASNRLRIVYRGGMWKKGSDYGFPFGYRISASNETHTYLGVSYTDRTLSVHIRNTTFTGAPILNDLQIHTIDVSLQRLIIDDVEYPNTNENKDEAWTATGGYMYIFGLGTNNKSYDGNSPDYFTMYYCKMYEGDTLVRDFIPAQRKSDSIYGMYDCVNKQFYTSKNSTNFTGG